MAAMHSGKRNIVQAIDEDDQAQAGNDLAENDNPDSPVRQIQRDLNFQSSPIPVGCVMQRQNSQANAIGGREDQENVRSGQHDTSFQMGYGNHHQRAQNANRRNS